jgi:hypothetical protein
MKNIRILFAVLLTVVTLTHSKPSQAAVSIFTGGATAIVGLKVIGVGVVGGLTGMAVVGANCDGECLEPIIPFILGTLVVALGVVILDGEQQIEFQELNAKKASLLGVTKAERESFNSELDQVNMLLKEVAENMTSLEEPTAQDSVAAWNGVKDLVSPLTFSAMTKIASQK